jgi:hypothetical protein
MKKLKFLLSLTLLVLTAYSCEPEELPPSEPDAVEDVSANGDTDDEVTDRKGNS